MSSEIEKQFIESVKKGSLSEVKNVIGQVKIDCCEETGMTALMHASYKGNVEMVDYLLLNGADPNVDSHSDQYTPLMFAALSGSTEVCRILLKAGAKPDTTNKINRTAAQLGAFVGRHDCVSVINNFVDLNQIKYHTEKHGLEETAKLKVDLTDIVHQLIIIPNLHPIKIVLFIDENRNLLESHESVCKVLEFECQKAYRDVNEILAIKLHLFTCILQKCDAWESKKEGKGGIKGLLKFLVKGREKDGFQLAVENLLRDAIKSFPYATSNVFQQIIRTLSPITPGNDPSALAVLTQSLNGAQSADFSECCACCGTRHSRNKCSLCKMVRYCNSVCQKLHWSNHKNFCKQLKIQYEKIQAAEKLQKEEEEELKQQQQQQQIEEQSSKVTEEAETTATKLEDIHLEDEPTNTPEDS